ncbi:Protein TIFY 10A [Striga hermonthica]|uniref:Protein TIFY 10A n=1 Tax=Striga hermonthica TaxID=68872 RepID=A0A9N7MXJ9_STRHE|nr:Protein TIFY 10A [Striga hermonthica]
MGSAEIVDSRRLSSGRSNFSQMCTLLSQYLKKNGSFGDLQLGLTQSPENKVSPVETMNLFPMIGKSGSGDLEAPPASFHQGAPAAAAAGRDETLKKPNFRKNSLARFLEKRKDRITANAPYPASKPEAPSKLAAASSEPGLAPELIQRH